MRDINMSNFRVLLSLSDFIPKSAQPNTATI